MKQLELNHVVSSSVLLTLPNELIIIKIQYTERIKNTLTNENYTLTKLYDSAYA